MKKTTLLSFATINRLSQGFWRHLHALDENTAKITVNVWQGKMENLMSNSSRKIRALKYLWIKNQSYRVKELNDPIWGKERCKKNLYSLTFSFFQPQLSGNLEAFVWRIKFLASQQMYVLQLWRKKPSARYLFLVTYKYSETSIINSQLVGHRTCIHCNFCCVWPSSKKPRKNILFIQTYTGFQLGTAKKAYPLRQHVSVRAMVWLNII